MSIIDTSYFFGDIDLAVSFNPALSAALDTAIARYEDDLLKQLLGYKAWKELKSAIAKSELLDDDPDYVELPAKWNSLLNGAEFTFDLNGQSVTQYWEGLKNEKKVSPLAYWVYYMYRKERDSVFSAVGDVKSTVENGVVVSPRRKLIDAWNTMIDLYGQGLNIWNTNTDYCFYNDDPSAFNFLLANVSDYPDWRFTPIEKINTWGL